MITKRNIGVSILLCILTCGIYAIYWFVKLTDEINYVTGNTDTSGGTAFLLGLVTCGIYTFFWAYKMGEKIDACDTVSRSRGILYLILTFFGLGIIVYALMQDILNKAY